ncbi:DMT family transporter [Tepidibacter aestuarii]|uniref:DMT family transporter n=1 Tax=Tepidibacter aestuarii TaxID=2925782 RepID=UPI0020C13EC1|nr:DMT family transporter [Tepidibacter aestuarii]CAH2214645.1 drug/metabolite transporter, DME family [Tepidibacter aestuarii]
MDNIDKQKGFILVIIAAAFWGYMGVPTRNLGNLNFDPFEISFFRTLIASVFYFLYCLKKKPNSLKVDYKGIIFFMIYGISAFTLTFISYNISINYVSVSIATVLMFTCPVWVVVLSHFLFNEEINKNKSIAIILNLFGCFMISKGYEFSNFSISIKGIIFGLISGFSFALQGVLAKIVDEKYDKDCLLAYSFLFGTLFLIFFVDFKNTVNIFKGTNDMYFIIKNIIGVGLFNTVIANGSYVKAVEYLEASVCSIIVSLELVVAAIVAYFVFNEALEVLQIIGMIMVILSIVVINVKKKEKIDEDVENAEI